MLKKKIRTLIAQKTAQYFIIPSMLIWMLLFHVSSVMDLNQNAIEYAFAFLVSSVVIIFLIVRYMTLKDLDEDNKFES
jgi:uncharacterized membrane-anchored protein